MRGLAILFVHSLFSQLNGFEFTVAVYTEWCAVCILYIMLKACCKFTCQSPWVQCSGVQLSIHNNANM